MGAEPFKSPLKPNSDWTNGELCNQLLVCLWTVRPADGQTPCGEKLWQIVLWEGKKNSFNAVSKINQVPRNNENGDLNAQNYKNVTKIIRNVMLILP